MRSLKRVWSTVGLAWLIAALLSTGLLPVGGGITALAAGDGLNLDAMLHDSFSDLYRTPLGAVPVQSTVILRFRTASGDADAVSVRVWNDFQHKQIMLPMQIVATTPDGYDLWEAALEVGKEPTIYWYRFIINAGSEVLFYEDNFRPGDPGQYFPALEGGPGTVYESSPDLSWQIAVYKPDYYTPEWMRNAVIYQIFPDRFRNGDPAHEPADDSLEYYDGLRSIIHETWNEPPVDPRQPGEYQDRWNVDFFGGDLAGIIQELDYLQALGVTAIYLNPIFEARSNHRYDTADFLAVDPLLGDLDTFQTLVNEAKARDMVIILDGVFNHLSSDSKFFDRYGRYEEVGACESLDSRYRLWFFFVPPTGAQPSVCVDNPQGATYYVSWGGFDSIPKIDSSASGPRIYFYQGRNSVVSTWGKMGIGGWRLDVGGDIDSGPGSDYWEGFRVAVRNVNPEGVIIGEEWGNATKWLLGSEWDSVMNYRMRRGILGFANAETFTDNDANGDNLMHALTPGQFESLMRDIESDYPPMAYHAMMNLLGSHDTSRALFVLGGDTQRLKLAALLQFMLPGAPTIYYGDEIALDAPSRPDSSGTLQDDPYNRAPYPWPDSEGNAYGPPDEDVLAFYRQLAALRHANPALREGEMITLVADDATGVYAFLRVDRASGNAVLVALNNSSADQRVALPLMFHLPTGLTLTPALGGDAIDTGAGYAVVTVPALGGRVWTVDGAPLTGPDAPANVQAIGEDGRVALSWDAVAGASGYLVYRSPVATGGFERLSWILDDPAYVDTEITNGYRYFYRVVALSDGLVPGAQSASAVAIPSAPVAEARYLLEDAPNRLTLAYGLSVELRAAVKVPGATETDGPAPGVLAEAVLLPADGDLGEAQWISMDYWGEADGADEYTALLPVTAAGEFSPIARFSSNAGESWTVVTFPDGSFPALTVAAPEDSTAPEAPASVTVAQASIAGVALEWEASPSEDVVAYRITRKDDGGSRVLSDVPANAELRYVDRGVAQGSKYEYAVIAVDGALNLSEPVTTGSVAVERARVPVTFVVTVPDYTKDGAGGLYIAGDFGTDTLPFWNPAGLAMTQIDDQHWTITLEIPEGANIQYKYARGSWNAVEKGMECEEIANRTVQVTAGTVDLTVEDLVAKWRDLDKCP